MSHWPMRRIRLFECSYTDYIIVSTQWLNLLGRSTNYVYSGMWTHPDKNPYWHDCRAAKVTSPNDCSVNGYCNTHLLCQQSYMG